MGTPKTGDTCAKASGGCSSSASSSRSKPVARVMEEGKGLKMGGSQGAPESDNAC